MIRMSIGALCALFLSLTASWAQSTLVASAETNVTGITTSQVMISRNTHHVLMGHFFVVERDGEIVRALRVHQRRDGVHRLRFDEAWSSGTALPFTGPVRPTDGCVFGQCRDIYVGTIFFSEGLFDRAQRSGLSARLVGPSGAVQIAAPASLFVDAARRAARL